MRIELNRWMLAAAVAVTLVWSGTSLAATMTDTDFEGFSTGVSVDGQGGWSATGDWDEEVVDLGGNTAWRVSNAATAGSFGDMPFSPRPGGIPTDTVTDPDNSSPDAFAGESSTGAANRRFFAEFDFKTVTGAPQPGLSVTVSADNGSGGRQSFIDIEESAVATSGIDIVTFDVDDDGNFLPATTIAAGLSYTDWHTVGMEVLFNDGPDNDVVNYYVNGSLVHTATSWEEFYSNQQAAQHPLGVPVQSLLFRLSSGAVPAVEGQGFYIDNVSTLVVPEPTSLALVGLSCVALMGSIPWRRRLSA